jgi:hypothetical protein
MSRDESKYDLQATRDLIAAWLNALAKLAQEKS